MLVRGVGCSGQWTQERAGQGVRGGGAFGPQCGPTEVGGGQLLCHVTKLIVLCPSVGHLPPLWSRLCVDVPHSKQLAYMAAPWFSSFRHC